MTDPTITPAAVLSRLQCTSGPTPAAAHGLLAHGDLDPGAKLPANVGFLSVEGDAVWDRVGERARIEFPHLFAAKPEPPVRHFVSGGAGRTVYDTSLC